MGYVFAESEVRTIHVTGKRLEDGRGRHGTTTTRYVIETEQGALPILTFPIIGYSLGAEDVYAGISAGDQLEVRVGQWPPGMLGNSGRTYIMTVF
jgi:hypothetical protein